MKFARRVRYDLLWSGCAGLIALMLAYWNYGWDRFRQVDFKIPFDYWGDVLITLPTIKAVTTEDWWPFTPLHSDRAGAPFGMNTGDWPQSENINFILFKVLGWLLRDPAQILNLYFAISFFLVAATTTYVLRRWRLQPVLAIACGIVFALLPYHYLRFHHVLLSNYWAVPVAIHYALKLGRKRVLFRQRERWSWKELKGFAVFAFLLAGSGIYYAFFTCFFLLAAGLSAWRARGNRRSFWSAGLASAIISFFVFVNLYPHMLYVFNNGRNPRVSVRSAGDAEFYSLRLMNLLTPLPDHNWPFMIWLNQKFPRPVINFEGVGEYMGLLAILGTLILIGGIVRRRKSGLVPELGFLWVSGFLLGTYGGFGELFNSLVYAGIRCYNRLSPFLALMGLIALFFTLHRFLLRRRWSAYPTLLAALPVAVAGVWIALSDQVGTTMKSLRPWDRYLSDQNFVRQIEAQNPGVHMILQLPFISFPEAGNVELMPDFAHFVGYTNSDRLRWSYGIMRDRPGELTLKMLSHEPLDLSAIRAENYDGIYIDRAGYADSGEAVIKQLRELIASPPSFSRDGRLAFFGGTRFPSQKRRGDEQPASNGK